MAVNYGYPASIVLGGVGGSGADEKVKVSANDTTEDYLINKIVAGTNITVNELGDGGNETLEIVAAGGSGTTINTAVGEVNQAGVATLYEVDFTALPNQDLTAGGDDDVIINGKKWWVDNTGAADVLDILNGTGLRIHPDNTATFWSGATRTAPIIGIRLADVSDRLQGIGNLPPVIRAWIIFSHNADQNTERVSFGVESESLGGGTFDDKVAILERGHFSGVDAWRATSRYATTNDTTSVSTTSTADDVMMLRIAGENIEMYTGASVGGDFPAEADMKRRFYSTVEGGFGVTQLGLEELLANFRVAMSAGPNNTNNNFEVTVTKFKCDAIGLPPIREPGIQTVLDIDFTTLDTQDLTAGGDGNKTIAGKTFYADNTANAAKMAITNGVGLEMDSNTTSGSNFGSTRTAPTLGIRLPDIADGMNYADLPFVRVWMIMTSNEDANFEAVQGGFERKHAGSFVGGTWNYWQWYREFSGPHRFASIVGLSGANTTTYANASDNITDDVMMVKLYSTGQSEVYTGVSVGGNFPDISVMRKRANGLVPTANGFRMESAAEMAVNMAVASNNGSGNLESTWTRLKVDVPSNAVSETKVSPDSYERGASAAISGTATDTIKLGRTNFPGSAIGLGIQVEDAVTAGTVKAILVLDGVDTFSVQLDTTNPTSLVRTTNAGNFTIGVDQTVEVRVETSGYTHAGGSDSSVIVNVTLLNDTVTAGTPNLLAGPATVLDVNFAAEPTQDLTTGGDGEKVIAGKTFYVANTANTDTFGITNGTGLVIDHSTANTQILNTVRTGPIFGIAFEKLGIVDPMATVRVWVILSSKTLSTGLDRMWVGVENQQSGTNAHSWQHGQQLSGSVIWLPLLNNNGAQTNASAGTTDVSDDVWMFELRGNDGIGYSGVSVGGQFPPIKDMSARAFLRYDSVVGAINTRLVSDMAAFFAMDTQNAGGTAAATITRMKIEAK